MGPQPTHLASLSFVPESPVSESRYPSCLDRANFSQKKGPNALSTTDCRSQSYWSRS